MKRDTLVGTELEKANFDGAASRNKVVEVHLHVSIRVEDDGLLDIIDDILCHFERVSRVSLALGMDDFNTHLAFSEGSGLSSDDFMELT